MTHLVSNHMSFQKLSAFGEPQISSAATIAHGWRKLPSTLPELTDFLHGGLPFASVIEWGLPWGHEVREVVLSLLAMTTSHRWDQPLWSLWVHTRERICVYPPAWEARGIDLSFIRFAYSRKPLDDLRAIFLDPFFKVIILDLSHGSSLKPEEMAFLARTARQQNQMIIILRDYLLSPQKGNVWAKLRLNCWRVDHQKLQLRIVKGLPPANLSLSMSLIGRKKPNHHC